jgi:glycine dehydrogenase subunit 2
MDNPASATRRRDATTSQTVVLEQGTLFEISRVGARGVALPPLDVPQPTLETSKLRQKPARLPELAEPEIVRHFTRLSTWNYAIDLGLYPLGSCTMKYNPRINEHLARSTMVCEAHPYDPPQWTQGHLRIMHELTEDLRNVTGLAAVSLMPAAGAQGELTGLMLIGRYHEARGNRQKKRKIITTDSAHGTNPASAALAGFDIVQIQSGPQGYVELADVQAVMGEDVAAMMLTNPNTLGIFEKNIEAIAQLLHDHDALLYVDGANLNAILGLTRPGDFGADVIQFNLHKTFSTPHGGGGPGSGPVAVSHRLAPYLPAPFVTRDADGRYTLSNSNPAYAQKDAAHTPLDRIKAFYGNFGMFLRAWVYIRALGSEGLHAVSENAILNANYLKARLRGRLNLPVEGVNLHEVVFNDKNSRESGLDTQGIAKRLIDYGFHPPTVYFPLCVKNALMIEPTESENLRELERFIDAVEEILDNASVTKDEIVPQRVPRTKVDEVKAARQLRLTHFTPEGGLS